jgi:hypothetical protein
LIFVRRLRVMPVRQQASGSKKAGRLVVPFLQWL